MTPSLICKKLGFSLLVAILLSATFFVGQYFVKSNMNADYANSYNQTQEHSDHNHPHSEIGGSIFEVVYTETGFSPSSLEIPVGSIVQFKNITEIPMWVASNPHPVHTDYSSFDARGDVMRNETYEYTFDQTGTFGYHNHSSSIHRGMIKVTNDQLPEIEVNKTPLSLQLVRDELMAMFNPSDSNTIFEIIDEIQSNPTLSLNCHDVAHDLGHRAYELYGFSEAMTFNNPNHVDHPLVQYICAGGYMHGILEALSINQPEFAANPDIICDSMPDIERDSCFHGVGHVFMLSNERNVEASLNDCRKLDVDTDMYRCFEGIRMEQFWGNTEHVSSNTLGWDPENPLSTCIDAKEDEKPTCYLYAPFGYLKEHPKDYFGAVRFCTESNISESDSSFCLKGLGITMMSKFQGKNLEGSEIYVTGMDPKLKFAFYQGVLGYAQLSGVGKTELKSTCSLFITDRELCMSVHQSMEPTFAAYARLLEEQVSERSLALETAKHYFTLANDRNLILIRSLFMENATFSSQDGGVYFGVSQIMDMLRNFYGEYRTLQWKVISSKEVRQGVVLMEFNFLGTTLIGEKVEKSGTAYVIVYDDKVQHIEMRDN